MLKKVMITIKSKNLALSDTLFRSIFGEEEPPYDEDEGEDDEPAETEISMEGKLRVTSGGEVTLSYEEGELSGMEGATTEVHFLESESGLVTMLRNGGGMRTAMVFEEGCRHNSVYDTPMMSFELCTHTLRVDNRLLSEGRIELDYVIEFRGAKAEHNLLTLTIYDAPDVPKGL